jgi:hypothetical protein
MPVGEYDATVVVRATNDPSKIIAIPVHYSVTPNELSNAPGHPSLVPSGGCGCKAAAPLRSSDVSALAAACATLLAARRRRRRRRRE